MTDTWTKSQQLLAELDKLKKGRVLCGDRISPHDRTDCSNHHSPTNTGGLTSVTSTPVAPRLRTIPNIEQHNDLTDRIGQIDLTGNQSEDWLALLTSVTEQNEHLEPTMRDRLLTNYYNRAKRSIPATECVRNEAYAHILVNYAILKRETSVDEARRAFQYARANVKSFAFVHVAAAQFELQIGNGSKAHRILKHAQELGAQPVSVISTAQSNMSLGHTDLHTHNDKENVYNGKLSVADLSNSALSSSGASKRYSWANSSSSGGSHDSAEEELYNKPVTNITTTTSTHNNNNNSSALRHRDVLNTLFPHSASKSTSTSSSSSGYSSNSEHSQHNNRNGSTPGSSERCHRDVFDAVQSSRPGFSVSQSVCKRTPLLRLPLHPQSASSSKDIKLKHIKHSLPLPRRVQKCRLPSLNESSSEDELPADSHQLAVPLSTTHRPPPLQRGVPVTSPLVNRPCYTPTALSGVNDPVTFGDNITHPITYSAQKNRSAASVAVLNSTTSQSQENVNEVGWSDLRVNTPSDPGVNTSSVPQRRVQRNLHSAFQDDQLSSGLTGGRGETLTTGRGGQCEPLTTGKDSVMRAQSTQHGHTGGYTEASNSRTLLATQATHPTHSTGSSVAPPVCGGFTQWSDKRVTVSGQSYILIKKLGEGGSSKVYKVLNERLDQCAMKIVDLSCEDETVMRGYINEVTLLKRLQYSERIVKLYNYEISRTKIHLVMELGCSDLAQYLKKQHKDFKMPEFLITYFWTQMLEAVSIIHKEGIVHCDLKPANFLLVSEECSVIMNLKLIDFGIANAIQTDQTSVTREAVVGTLNYMAPESLLEADNYSNSSRGDTGEQADQPKFKIRTKSDVWSLGCILHYMVYGRTPFQHITNFAIKLNTIVDDKHEIDFKPVHNSVIIQVLQSCLQRNPKLRPTVDELLQHNFVTSFQLF